jgi:invasion protein IalB
MQRFASEWGFTTTATAAGTTALSNTSTGYQLFTGATTQTVTLPSTATLATGWTFMIDNDSTGVITVQTVSPTSAVVATIPAGVSARFTVVSVAGDTAAAWAFGDNDFNTITGTGSGVLATTPTLTTPNITGPTIHTGALLFPSGNLFEYQPNPVPKTNTGTLTIADLLTRIVNATSATITLTLPTGTLMDGGMPAGIAINESFEWVVINTVAGVTTIAAGTGHTIVGLATVAATSSAQFRSRRTAANTWVTYRIS